MCRQANACVAQPHTVVTGSPWPLPLLQTHSHSLGSMTSGLCRTCWARTSSSRQLHSSASRRHRLFALSNVDSPMEPRGLYITSQCPPPGRSYMPSGSFAHLPSSSRSSSTLRVLCRTPGSHQPTGSTMLRSISTRLAVAIKPYLISSTDPSAQRSALNTMP